MNGMKKTLNERTQKKNGFYVHYSPPKLVGTKLRKWARIGGETNMERAVLAGQGHKLLSEAECLHLPANLSAMVAKCDSLHHAVEKGSLLELQEHLESDHHHRKLVLCLDAAGVGLLHKAIYYDYMDIAEWLVNHYPFLVNQRDADGRTPIFYASVCRDEAFATELLEGAGATRGVRDTAGHSPAFYRVHRNMLALPVQHVKPEGNKTNNPFIVHCWNNHTKVIITYLVNLVCLWFKE